MTNAQKARLIRLSGSDDFESALIFNSVAALKAVTNPWTDGELAAIIPLWMKLFSRGTNDTAANDSWEHYVSERGTNVFSQKMTMQALRILTKPRDADGHPYFDIENFPLFFEIADVETTVPTALPNSVTYADDDEDRSNPLPVKWKDWVIGSKQIELVGSKSLVGPFNFMDSKSFNHYLAIEESAGSGFTLLSKKEYDALVASSTPV